jgi:isopentenyl phosphate kinase
MPQKKLIIIKLGGSIITAKHLATPTVRRTLVKKIGTVLEKYYSPKKHALILIHGAGSFGHLHAKKHALAEGTKDHPEKLLLALENQKLDQQLNTEMVSLLLQVGLPVTGILSHAVAINTRGKLRSLNMESIRAALANGVIPVLHGDMVSDTRWGLSVCSGDVLAACLSRTFRAKAVFFASDVDGIFTSDPHLSKKATLIKKVCLDEIMSGRIKLGVSHNVDVTGGLSKKFSLFQKNLAPQLKNIYLFNGLHPKNFRFAFNQKNFFGTTLFFR